jgi:hypothetical protein
MNKLLSSFLVISFILWILPLGIFVKPSQEKLACDGQRAICMCHALVLKESDKAMEAGINLKAGSSTNKENSSAGAGNYFVSAKPKVILNLHATSFFENQYHCYKNPFLASLEYVPKV